MRDVITMTGPFYSIMSWLTKLPQSYWIFECRKGGAILTLLWKCPTFAITNLKMMNAWHTTEELRCCCCQWKDTLFPFWRKKARAWGDESMIYMATNAQDRSHYGQCWWMIALGCIIFLLKDFWCDVRWLRLTTRHCYIPTTCPPLGTAFGW